MSRVMAAREKRSDGLGFVRWDCHVARRVGVGVGVDEDEDDEGVGEMMEAFEPEEELEEVIEGVEMSLGTRDQIGLHWCLGEGFASL